MSFLPTELPTGLPMGLGGGASGETLISSVYATIGGQLVTIVHGSVTGDNAIGQASDLNFTVYDPTGGFAFTAGQPVILYGSDGSVLMRRWLVSAQRARTTQGNLLEHVIVCTDNHYLAQKRVFASTYTNETAQFIVNDLLTSVLSQEGVKAGVIGGASITIGNFTSNYALCSDVLDALCQQAQGYTWWIDDERRLYFQPSNPVPAPVTITDALMERNSETVTHGNPLYRNTQIMLGGLALTGTQTDTRIGDGHLTAFTLSYECSATAPTVTVNSVSKTVGVLNVDTGKDWYYQQGSNVLTQDSGGTVLTSSDTLQAVYVGQFQSVTISQDGAGVVARQAREGGDTSGIVESVATDTTISSVADGFAKGDGFLARYSQDCETLQFITQTPGFAQGQLALVDLPAYNLVGVEMLLESVTLSDTGPASSEVGVLYYTVKAVAGPVDMNWVQFFGGLATQAQTIINSINVGASTQVALAQSGTVALAWTVTGNATPITYGFPSSSTYPSPTLYPGTAGSPVTITWTKTNAGLNAIRDALTGAAGAPALDTTTGYFAWGTGTQGTPATATQLAAEAGRKPITSNVNGASVGEDIVTGYIGPTDGVGVAITEVAFFANATSGANTGTMLLYGLYSHTHTASEAIQVTADSTIS